MNILFLVHRIPFPPDKGDKIRSYNEIKYLASLGHKITLVTILDHVSDIKFMPKVQKYCEAVHFAYYYKWPRAVKALFSKTPFSVAYFYSYNLQRYINKVLSKNKINIVYCYCSSMAEYVFRTPEYKKNGLAGKKLVMDFVDLDSDKWLQYSKSTKFPLNLVYYMENKRMFRYEKKINRLFHNSIFVASREIDVFLRRYPEARNLSVIANGVNMNYFTPKENIDKQEDLGSGSSPALVFTGMMNYFANEDAVVWFCYKIFPLIQFEFPNAKFYIVGNKPTHAVKALSKLKGVVVTGYVEDIREYYIMADVCVIPLRIARGLQNKVLEAMVTGNAVVATSNASDGINCDKKADLMIADDERLFAESVIQLLKNGKMRSVLGRKALNSMRREYSWDENLSKLLNIINEPVGEVGGHEGKCPPPPNPVTLTYK